jgi:hypothetical protein
MTNPRKGAHSSFQRARELLMRAALAWHHCIHMLLLLELSIFGRPHSNIAHWLSRTATCEEREDGFKTERVAAHV